MSDIGKWPAGAGGDPNRRKERISFNPKLVRANQNVVASFSDHEVAEVIKASEPDRVESESLADV